MTSDEARRLLKPIESILIGIVHASHDAFFEKVAADCHASTSERTRAGFVFDQIKDRLLLQYGTRGTVRLKECSDNPQLSYLLVEGRPRSIGVRWKKAERFGLRTTNRDTDYQQRLRRNGAIDDNEFLFTDAAPAHLFLAYTETDDLIRPQVERIVFTNETTDGFRWWFPVYELNETPTIKFGGGLEQAEIGQPTFKIKPRKGVAQNDASTDAAGEGERKAGTDGA